VYINNISAGDLTGGGASARTTASSRTNAAMQTVILATAAASLDHDRPSTAVHSVPGTARRPWLIRYRASLVVLDFAAAAIASLLAFIVRVGATGPQVHFGVNIATSLVLPVLWLGVLAANRSYEAGVLGAGADEFRRIYISFLWLTAAIAIAAYASKVDLARGFVLLALPATCALTLLCRYGVRKRLHRQRRAGSALSRVLVIGSTAQALELARAGKRDIHAGLQIIGACVPSASRTDDESLRELGELGVPVLGDLDDLLDVVHQTDADAVAVAGSAELTSAKLRWISWQLEGTGIDLIVSPGLVEVAGTRLHVRPLLGLPLLHVEAPRFSGFHRLLKASFDRSAAALALLLLSPVFLSIVAVIRLTSKGPALFHQTRVGRDGSTFTMIKFRSMFVDAEDRLAELAHLNEAADGLLFKVRNDPRVTPIGRILRKFSLDELPQLINVLLGTMSLVGPRPPLPSEVARYDDDVRRRLLVKPGVTGLWQVSGRSDLSWEESIGLYLRYVENWSLTLDIFILWKTARAVFGGAGAY
jgi:exopolysaccharide biosynthesis polyprenyl glycosylphosphotransferase